MVYVLHRSEWTASRLARLELAADEAGHVSNLLKCCCRAVLVASAVRPVIHWFGLMVVFKSISSHIKQMAKRKNSEAKE